MRGPPRKNDEQWAEPKGTRPRVSCVLVTILCLGACAPISKQVTTDTLFGSNQSETSAPWPAHVVVHAQNRAEQLNVEALQHYKCTTRVTRSAEVIESTQRSLENSSTSLWLSGLLGAAALGLGSYMLIDAGDRPDTPSYDDSGNESLSEQDLGYLLGSVLTVGGFISFSTSVGNALRTIDSKRTIREYVDVVSRRDAICKTTPVGLRQVSLEMNHGQRLDLGRTDRQGRLTGNLSKVIPRRSFKGNEPMFEALLIVSGGGRASIDLRPTAEHLADEAWAQVADRSSIEGIDDFVNEYGWSQASVTARAERQRQINELDDRHWEKSLRRGTSVAYSDYLELHPKGRHKSEAIENALNKCRDEKRFDRAVKFIRTASDYGAITRREAAHWVRRLSEEEVESDWQQAKRIASVDRLDAYLKKHPSSDYTEDARTLIVRALINAGALEDLKRRFQSWCASGHDCETLGEFARNELNKWSIAVHTLRTGLESELISCGPGTPRYKRRRIVRKLFQRLQLFNIGLPDALRTELEDNIITTCRCSRACAGLR
jgi:hypothetical protein